MGCINLSLSFLGLCLMFEKSQALVTNAHTLDPKSINAEDEENKNESDYDKNLLLNNKKNVYFPKLSLLDALKIKDLYLISFIFAFCSIAISIYTSQFKVSEICRDVFESFNFIIN